MLADSEQVSEQCGTYLALVLLANVPTLHTDAGVLCTVIVAHEFVQYVDPYLPPAVPESLSNSKADTTMTTAEDTSKLTRLPYNSGYLNLIREQKA